MLDQIQPAGAASSALVTSDARPSRGIVGFELRRLPYELRRKVAQAAAAKAHTRDTRCLVLVNKEFYEFVVPYHWHVRRQDRLVPYPRADSPNLQTISLTNYPMNQVVALLSTVLPRYGPHIKRVILYETYAPDPWRSKHQRQLAEVMASLPNLASLKMGDHLYDLVSTSAKLTNLTSLWMEKYDTELSTADVAAVISRSPNLERLALYVTFTTRSERPLLINALASRKSLTWLAISPNCDFFGKAFATAKWQCPLATLGIHHDIPEYELSLPLFRTFISHFSGTLRIFDMTASFTSWTIPINLPTLPFDLPHLVAVKLFDGSASSSSPRILELFDNSPLKKTTLYGFVGDNTGRTSVRNHLDAHKETLRTVQFVRREIRVDPELIAYANGLGIELTMTEYVRSGDEESIADEWVEATATGHRGS
jgi:hypothetical protein